MSKGTSVFMEKPYKIMDIQDIKGNTRTDGRYPLRIGSIIEFVYPFIPMKDMVALCSYIKDNEGNEKQGTLKTSTVQKIYNDELDDTILIIETLNSVYFLKKEDE